MDQTINIADLVKPKFEAGQDVFVVRRDYRGAINSIQAARIKSAIFTVKSEYKPAAFSKARVDKTSILLYMTMDDSQFSEDSIIASLDDLPDEDRKPRIG